MPRVLLLLAEKEKKIGLLFYYDVVSIGCGGVVDRVIDRT